MRNDLIEAILDCGANDMSLLDDAEANMFEIIAKMKEEGLNINLMGIVEEVFNEGIFQIAESVNEVKERLEHEEKCGSLTESGYEQLEAIRSYDLNPLYDFRYYLNFLDTHLYCASNKKEIYEEFFEQEMNNLMNYTGFDIEEG